MRRVAAAVVLVGALPAAIAFYTANRDREQPGAGSLAALDRRTGASPDATQAALGPPTDAVHTRSAAAANRPSAPSAAVHGSRGRPRSPGKAGSLVAVPGTGPVLGEGGAPRRFVVEVEGGLRIDGVAFARAVERVLGDSRGWSRAGGIAFRRVAGESVDFRVTLASPSKTDELCRPLQTNGIFSCYMDGRAVLNFARWRRGAASYAGDLSGYRTYMVNHEVGHALGHGHASCTEAGARAPVMVQQTKGVRPCRPNPWPLASEID